MTKDSSPASPLNARVWFLSTLAGLAIATGAAAPAAAQTIYVKGAPRDSVVEATLRQASATGKPGPDGVATLALNAIQDRTAEMVVHVHVDGCGSTFRVVLAETSVAAPAPQPGCTRHDVGGAYVLRSVTSLAIDVRPQTPALMIRQGPPSSAWFKDQMESKGNVVHFEAPTGLMIFGGGGFGKIHDAVRLFCGDVPQCSGDSYRPAFEGGAAFWLSPYIGAIGSYASMGKTTADGSSDRFRFTSEMDAEVLTAAGLVGVPARRAKIYGLGGLNYHRARFTTVQTTDPVTATIDDLPVVFQGGTQTLEFETSGWGWVFGGGVDVWTKWPIAIYGQFQIAGLKGDDRSGGEARINDKMTLIVVGVRYRLSRR
jgi:hypothetical protein